MDSVELKNEIFKLKIEKETYTSILASQSDWMIMYVSILFVIFGIYGFIVSRNIVESIGEKYKKKTEKQDRVISDHKDEFLRLESYSCKAWAYLNDLAKKFYKDKNHDILLMPR